MRKFLLYLGLSFFFTFSATTMYGIFRPVEIEPPTEQPPEAPILSLNIPSEINSEPIEPATAKPIIENEPKIAETEDDDYNHTDELIDEYREKQKEQDEYYEKLEKQREAEAKKKADDLAYKKKLAEQKQIAEQLALEKKRQQCKSDLQKCLNDVGPKAMRMSLSGSAYNSAVRAMQNSCNRQYHCN